MQVTENVNKASFIEAIKQSDRTDIIQVSRTHTISLILVLSHIVLSSILASHVKSISLLAACSSHWAF